MIDKSLLTKNYYDQQEANIKHVSNVSMKAVLSTLDHFFYKYKLFYTYDCEPYFWEKLKWDNYLSHLHNSQSPTCLEIIIQKQ